MHLRQLSKDLGKRSGRSHWVEMSERIEALVKSEKKLNANVDFYSASMYYALGIPSRSSKVAGNGDAVYVVRLLHGAQQWP